MESPLLGSHSELLLILLIFSKLLEFVTWLILLLMLADLAFSWDSKPSVQFSHTHKQIFAGKQRFEDQNDWLFAQSEEQCDGSF